MTEPASIVFGNEVRPPIALPAFVCRRAVLKRLESIRFGELVVVDEAGARSFGVPGSGPRATVRIHDPSAWISIALGGSLGAGESFMEGLWSTDDLVAVVRISLRASSRLSNLDGGGLSSMRNALGHLQHRLRRNTREGSRRNIAQHYDLGNAFYALWLDESMMYSSALWERADMTLQEAQSARLQRICTKLALSRNDHVLEIGTGWGAMAIHAARHFGCRVTTTTISAEQYAAASERVRRAGLQAQVTVLREDYRDLGGRYDKLVSIEMIEAVGEQYLGTFFSKVGTLMKPDGLGLIQAITIPDDRFERSVGQVDFIKRYVFPGGQLPSLHAMSRAWAKHTDLRLLHYEDFGEHYARTLHQWRHRFRLRSHAIEELGHSKRFQRMWEFYLASCEGAFLERHCGVAQLLLARPEARRPPVLGRLT